MKVTEEISIFKIYPIPKHAKIDKNKLLIIKRLDNNRCGPANSSIHSCAKRARGGGGVLPYMGYIGMCRCEGYGFQAVYSRIGYINQSVWV